MSSTFDVVKALMVDRFGVDESAVKPDTKLETLGLDSLAIVEFMFFIEERHGIKVKSDDIDIDTVQDVVELIDRLKSSSGS